MKSITLSIKGRDWTFNLLSDKKYDKLYNQDEDQSVAMTVHSAYKVDFRKSDWDLISIRHELFHVLHQMSLVSSTNLTVSDVEELGAEIIGHHYADIGIWTDRIAEKFFSRD